MSFPYSARLRQSQRYEQYPSCIRVTSSPFDPLDTYAHTETFRHWLGIEKTDERATARVYSSLGDGCVHRDCDLLRANFILSHFLSPFILYLQSINFPFQFNVHTHTHTFPVIPFSLLTFFPVWKVLSCFVSCYQEQLFFQTEFSSSTSYFCDLISLCWFFCCALSFPIVFFIHTLHFLHYSGSWFFIETSFVE